MSNTVTKERIDQLIADSLTEQSTIGSKTTFVRLILPCGFELTETSSCVDPANYDPEIGKEICMKRITDRLWQLEGYRLAWQLHERKENANV